MMLYLTIMLTIFLTIKFAFFVKRFINPYRLYMVFGKKGSGKTTYMCKLAYKYHKRGRKIFSNIPLPYSTLIDIKTLGSFVPPPESVLLVDEVGMIWDNRNFKNFREDVRDYFKLQRHYRNIVYLFSQTFDIDLKLRNLTDAMYLCTSPFPFLSVVRRIKRTIVLVQPNQESEGRIADSLEFVPLYMALFGSKPLQLTYIPRWADFFDSHTAPELFKWESKPQAPSYDPSKYYSRNLSNLLTKAIKNVILYMSKIINYIIGGIDNETFIYYYFFSSTNTERFFF